MALPDRAYPGLALASASRYRAGPGTHIQGNTICASLIGDVAVDAKIEKIAASALPTLMVRRAMPSSMDSRSGLGAETEHGIGTGTGTLPMVGSIVLARVTRIQARQINVAILVVDDQVCADAFQGIVRKEDVRGWELDKVVMSESFRVGDVLRGVVISLGDQASYYLSTARNELGVLLATSQTGNQMYPVSWKAFKDPDTGKLESRKVAKPL